MRVLALGVGLALVPCQIIVEPDRVVGTMQAQAQIRQGTRAEAALLEQAVARDARTWARYTYDQRSLRNVRVVGAHGDTISLRGDYTYNGGQPEWVIGEVRGGVVQCLRYQSNRACDPIGRGQWAVAGGAPAATTRTAVAAASARPGSVRPSTVLARELEQALIEDASDWRYNVLDPGSFSSPQVMLRTGNTIILRGSYTYNNGSEGWVDGHFVNGRLSCVQFHDISSCRAVRRIVPDDAPLVRSLSACLKIKQYDAQSRIPRKCNADGQCEGTASEINYVAEYLVNECPTPQKVEQTCSGFGISSTKVYELGLRGRMETNPACVFRLPASAPRRR